jgi:hypothetical protein
LSLDTWERGSIPWREELLIMMRTMHWKAQREAQEYVALPHSPLYLQPAHAMSWIGDLITEVQKKLDADKEAM